MTSHSVEVENVSADPSDPFDMAGADAREAAFRAYVAKEEADIAAWRTGTVQRLRELVGERRWALHSKVRAEALDLASRESLTDNEIERAELLVTRAQSAVDAAMKKVDAATAPRTDLALAVDPMVRTAALDALREIAKDDSDWATEENGVGYSKSTTILGHALAEMRELSTPQTAAALRILRVHHHQVSAALKAMLRIA